MRKWLRIFAIAAVAIIVLYVLPANVFLNSEMASWLINRKPEKLWIQWEKGWTLFPGIVHVKGLQIRGQDRRLQWYAELKEITASIDLIPLLWKRFHVDAMQGRGLEFRLRQRIRLDEPPPTYANLTPPIPGLTNPPQPSPEELYPPSTPRSPWTLEMNNIAISDVHTLWIEQFRFEGDGRIEGSMIHTIKGPLEVPRASVALTSGNWWIGNAVVEEDSRLHADIRIHEFVPREQKGTNALRFISGTVHHVAKVKSLNFLKVYFRKVPGLSIDGSGVLDAKLHLEKGVLSQGTKVGVDMTGTTTNVAGYTITTEGPGKLEGRVELENAKPLATVSVTLETFELARAQAQEPFALGHHLQVSGTSGELDLRDPFTDLTLILDLPNAEVPDLSFFNTFIPKEMGLTIRGGNGRLHSRFRGSPEKRGVKSEIELIGQNVVMQYEDFTIGADLRVKADLEYGLEDDDEGLIVFSDVPLEVSKLSLALTSGTVRKQKETIAQDLTVKLESAFDQYTLDPHKTLDAFRFTSGSVRVTGTIPNLRYVNDYLPPETGLHIRSGTGQIQVQLETASGQPDATGDFALIGDAVTADLGDFAVAGDLKVNADIQYGLQKQDDKGLVVFSEEGRLEVLKASVALLSGTVRDRQRTIAADLTLEAESEFDQYTLDAKSLLDLPRFMSASARVAGTVPDLSYLNDYIPRQTGLRIRSGAGQIGGHFNTAPRQATVTGDITFVTNDIAAKFKDATIGGNLKAQADIRYGFADKRDSGLVILTEGPLAIPRASIQLRSGRVLLRDGKAVENLEVSVNSTFDHLPLHQWVGRDALRALSGSVNISSHVPDLRFLEAYFSKAPWLQLDGAGQMNADVHIRKGVLMAGSRLTVDSEEIRTNFLDYKASGSGKVRGQVVRENGKTFSTVTVSLNDFKFARLEYLQPYIFGTGLTVTGTSQKLDLTNPFTDLKVSIDLPESDLPNFGFYNAYIPPESCIFIHQGHGRISSHLNFDARTESATGEIEFDVERVIIQFAGVTLATDLKVRTRLKNGDIPSRTFEMEGTKVELNNAYLGSGKIGTDNTWWARLALPKAKGQFTTPAQLDARVEMRLRDLRPVVVFLAEKKKIVRWFNKLLTVKDIEAGADFKMEGKAIEVADLEMTGDRFEVLGELDIFSRQFAGVFYTRLHGLSVAVELTDTKKKWKLVNSRPWFEKRRQAYQAHKWFEKQDWVPRELSPEPDAVVTKNKRKKSAQTGCWQQ